MPRSKTPSPRAQPASTLDSAWPSTGVTVSADRNTSISGPTTSRSTLHCFGYPRSARVASGRAATLTRVGLPPTGIVRKVSDLAYLATSSHSPSPDSPGAPPRATGSGPRPRTAAERANSGRRPVEPGNPRSAWKPWNKETSHQACEIVDFSDTMLRSQPQSNGNVRNTAAPIGVATLLGANTHSIIECARSY